ncbi:Ig-like domain-containing protein [Patescibacteria group bacterium]|nr:Ig-like domain-containing protein [Patescibacteria group bacterium]
MAEEKTAVLNQPASPGTGQQPALPNQEAAAPSEQPVSTKKIRNRVILVLFLLAGLFLLAKFVIPQALVYLTKAAKPTKYSLSNSYVFGAPLVCEADGKTKCMVNVFLLNDQGLGAPDKQIALFSRPKANAAGNTLINGVQEITDNFGKAVFEVTSGNPGQFEISAEVEGIEIPQKVTLTFK